MAKILFVVDERKMGGVSILLEDLLNNLELANNTIDILVLHNNGNRFENIPNNINIIYGNSSFDVVDISTKQLLKLRKYLKAIKKMYISLLIKTGCIKRYIIKNRKKMNIANYDIEIAFKGGFCSLFTAYGKSSKKVTWIHEDYAKNDCTKKYRKTFSNCFNMFDKLVLVSDDAKLSFEKIYGLNNKTLTIENYVDDERIKVMSKADLTKEENKLFSKEFTFITVARLAQEKRIDRIIVAVNTLVNEEKITNFKVIIIGDGYEGVELKEQVSSRVLDEYITFIGEQSNPYKYINKSDCFILSSETESFGITRVEALILETPVISTDVPYTDELLVNDTYGLKVENSIKGVYEGMKKMLLDEKHFSNIKTNCINYRYNKNDEILDRIKGEILNI